MRLVLRDVWAGPPGVAEPAVRGVSLELAPGEWCAIGGPNGCGKSTLLQVAAGLLGPRRGTRETGPGAGGRPLRVATILQDPSVQFFTATVAEEVGLTALHLGDPETSIAGQVEAWCRALDLDRDRASEPGTLSAGRQQLVLIAAALASSPDLLVADEAGAHLDLEARERVLAALRSECARGLTILWATQEDREWRPAARVLQMREGRIEAAVGPGAAGAGATARPAPRPEDAPWPRVGPPTSGVRIRIEPDAGREGPRVPTRAAFDLVLDGPGLLALEGPNGSGKSVILSAACGLIESPQIQVERPAGGAAPLLVGQYPERQIFEERVEDEVAFAATARGVGRDRALGEAARAFEALGSPGLLGEGRRTWELSAGERRLVLLVGALIAPAGLLALDEPTAGLDPARRAALARLVRQAATRTPVLVAGQDSDWISDLGGYRRRIGQVGEADSSPSKKTD